MGIFEQNPSDDVGRVFYSSPLPSVSETQAGIEESLYSQGILLVGATEIERRRAGPPTY